MFNSEYGIINMLFHVDVNWITDPNVVIVTVAIVAIWSAIGYDAVLLLSGIQKGYRDRLKELEAEGMQK